MTMLVPGRMFTHRGRPTGGGREQRRRKEGGEGMGWNGMNRVNYYWLTCSKEYDFVNLLL